MVDLCKIILWNYGFMYGFNWDFTKKNWVQHPTIFLGLFHEIWGKIPAIEMGQDICGLHRENFSVSIAN
jgi:hypothetical protein